MIILILIIIIVLIVLRLNRHMTKYYDNKLEDMNNCYGFPCDKCEKYQKGCNGRDEWEWKDEDNFPIDGNYN